ncbi:MAG: TPM domain-containing protein [Cyanobacteria bacterium P01_A01_bin.37]
MTQILLAEGVARAIAKVKLQRVPFILLGLMLSFMVVASPALATSLYEMPLVHAGGDTWIVDKAEVISRANEGRLMRDFEALSEETGTEIRMATIRRMDYGETIDSFTDKLFERWYPTREEQENQVLLVIDQVTNTVGIRIGDGVEDTMPDAIAQSVAKETAIVPLRKGDKYNQAFLDASERMVAVLSGEPDPGPPILEDEIMSESTFTSAEDTDTNNATVLVIGFLVAATIIPMATYYIYQILQS